MGGGIVRFLMLVERLEFAEALPQLETVRSM